MQTLSFNKDFGKLISSNLLHNRINIKWKPIANFTLATELRNRMFWGEEVKLTPGFASRLRNANDKLDMQKIWIEDSSLVVHTNVERLYADYGIGKVNIRIGRQRINWGMTTTWNPNDIFNTYNFLDFDYEERPGSDAGKIQYRINDMMNIEAAYAVTGIKNESIAAAKLLLYKWGYDLQLISGVYKNHITIGGGWAGNISDAGFKGEVQYFMSNQDSSGHLNLTMEGDYVFQHGWYVNAGVLLNSNGLTKPVTGPEIIDLRISPESLMPTKWNIIVTSSKEITPLFSVTAGILYAPGTNLLIFLPSLQYSMAENLDINIFWQSFYAEMNNEFKANGHRGFLRIKWSF